MYITFICALPVLQVGPAWGIAGVVALLGSSHVRRGLSLYTVHDSLTGLLADSQYCLYQCLCYSYIICECTYV